MPVPAFDPMYGQDVAPDFGQSPPMGYPGIGLLPQYGPGLPPNFGPDYSTDSFQAPVDPLLSMHTDVDQARQRYMDAIMAQGDVPPMQMGNPPGLSGLQAGIGGVLGLIGAASGPHGNGPGIAGQFVQGAMQQNNGRFHTAIENMKAARQSELDRRRLKAQVSQLDYEDKAREYGQQVQFKHQDQQQEATFTRQQMVQDRLDARARATAQIKAASAEKIALLRNPTPESIRDEMLKANAASVASGGDPVYSTEELATIPYAKQFQAIGAYRKSQAEADFKRAVIDPTVAKLGAEKKALEAHAGEWAAHARYLSQQALFLPFEMQATIVEKEARAFAVRKQAEAAMIRAQRTGNGQDKATATAYVTATREAYKADIDHWQKAIDKIEDLKQHGFYGTMDDLDNEMRARGTNKYEEAKAAATEGYNKAKQAMLDFGTGGPPGPNP